MQTEALIQRSLRAHWGGNRRFRALPPVVRLFVVVFAGLALFLIDAADASALADQGSAGMAPQATSDKLRQERVSPHILAARKRAASGQAIHAPVTLQTQMQKQAVRHHMVAAKKR
jgi:hypothetical protein